MLAGPDVSSNNGQVAWSHMQLGAGQGELAFAFAKATEGATWNDPLFGENWHGIRARGLFRGAYHFAHPGRNSAQAEAEHFLDVLHRVGGIHPGDLPPVLDLEVSQGLAGAQLHAWVQTWVEIVARHVGRPPIIYTGGFWKSNLTTFPTAWGCPLWLAQYGPAAQVPRPWARWTFWQHTDSARIAGIAGNADLSWFNGSHADLQALAGGPIGSHAAPVHHNGAAPHAAVPHPAAGHPAPAAAPHPAAGQPASAPAAHPPAAPAAHATGGAPPYPGHPLALGATGPHVRAWQLRMRERGFVTVPTSGTFDATCAEQCRWLQLYLRVPATEQVDAHLWHATWTAP